MTDELNFQSIQQPLEKAKDALVLLTANPNLDSVAAGLSLYLSLKNKGLNVVIACPTDMTVAFNRLIGVNKVSNSIGNRNLVISFDYLKDSIEKVSYNIEDNKFNLVVEPKANFTPLDSDKVSYSYTGAQADIIFIVGATKLVDLGVFYNQEKKLFNEKLTVNVDNKSNNTRFGKINLFDNQASSCSEIVAKMIRSLNLPFNEDLATNLYAGIKTTTSNFQSPNVSADTFDISAWCLKNGAKKDYISTPAGSVGQPVQQPAFQSFFQPKATIPIQPPIQSPPLVQSQPQQVTVQPQQFKSDEVTQDKPIVSKAETSPKPPFTQGDKEERKKKPQPPSDWFKPKIYHGNDQV